MDNRWQPHQAQAQFVQQRVIYSVNQYPPMMQSQPQPPQVQTQMWPQQQYQMMVMPTGQQTPVPGVFVPDQQNLQYQPMSQAQGFNIPAQPIMSNAPPQQGQFIQNQPTFSQPMLPYVPQQQLILPQSQFLQPQPGPTQQQPPPQPLQLMGQQPMQQGVPVHVQQTQQPMAVSSQQMIQPPPQPTGTVHSLVQQSVSNPPPMQPVVSTQQGQVMNQAVSSQQMIQPPPQPTGTVQSYVSVSNPPPMQTLVSTQEQQVMNQDYQKPVQLSQQIVSQQSVSNQQPEPSKPAKAVELSHPEISQSPSPAKPTGGTDLCKTRDDVLIAEKPELKKPQEIKVEILSDDNEPAPAPIDDMSGMMYVNSKSGSIEAVTIQHEPRRGRRKKASTCGTATGTAPKSTDSFRFGDLDVTSEEAVAVKQFIQNMRAPDTPQSER